MQETHIQYAYRLDYCKSFYIILEAYILKRMDMFVAAGNIATIVWNSMTSSKTVLSSWRKELGAVKIKHGLFTVITLCSTNNGQFGNYRKDILPEYKDVIWTRYEFLLDREYTNDVVDYYYKYLEFLQRDRTFSDKME